jgi:hypothetical protein
MKAIILALLIITLTQAFQIGKGLPTAKLTPTSPAQNLHFFSYIGEGVTN